MTGQRANDPTRCHARRVLLTVSGLSPQIITETIYALGVRPGSTDGTFLPTEVHALTTSEGADRIRLALLTPQSSGRPGGFHRLCRDFALPPIMFGEDQIHVVRDASGQPLPDIRSDADNALMADAITELVRQFTADPDCTLHVSLAGGRKTMGYYAGYALSLFGREQDRLSHVLVSSPFESLPDFFYPTPTSEALPLRSGGWVDASQAELSLAQIPFVRLRDVLPPDMLQARASFTRAVQAAAQRLAPPRLVVNAAQRQIEADGKVLPLSPWQFALLALLAWRNLAGSPPLRAPLRDAHDADWAEEVLQQLRQALGEMLVPDTVEDLLRREASGANLSPHWSRLRRQLDLALGAGRATRYFDDGGTQRNKRYRVPLPPDAIQFAHAEPATHATASLPAPRRR